MKSLLSQRYVYKVDSSYLTKNKYKINIPNVKEGIKNGQIVSIGDSQCTRFIRDLTDFSGFRSESHIRVLEASIRAINKSGESGSKTKKKLLKLHEDLYNAKLEPNLCNIVFETEKQYNYIVKNGITINNIKYKLLLGTPGGIKNNTVLFINEEIKDKLMEKLWCGFNKETPFMPSKLMGYMSLTLSQSTPVTNTRRILVVKDVETHFKDTVNKIKFNEDLGRPDIVYTPNADITVNACDGCGMITPELALIWSEDLQLGYNSVGFCLRYAWTKGMLTVFDYKRYCKEVIGKEIVKDVWGNEHNINDIDIILNQSMLKCWKAYNSLEDYLDNCDKYGYNMAVTKTVPKELEKERALNYQYLQCLDLSDEDINNLLSKDINEIKDVMGLDYRKTILFGKGTELNDKNVWNDKIEEDRFVKALMIDKNIIHDEYVRKRIRTLIQKRIRLLKTGKIKVNGNYQIIIGEPIIQLEHMFGLEPKGLLNRNEFYIEYWREQDIEEVAAFRSPMSCKSNARIMNVCHREEVIKWYGHIKNMIIFNAWDTTMSALNGADKSLFAIN